MTEEIDNRLDNMMLTTIDNPYNPKEEYGKWKQYDMDHNYNTEEYISRIMDLPVDVDIDNAYEVTKYSHKAIHEILANDFLGIYKLV